MKYNLPLPDVTYRRPFYSEPTRGDVVAFCKETSMGIRTGIIILESDKWFLAAINLYEDEDYIWQQDQMQMTFTFMRQRMKKGNGDKDISLSTSM